MMWDFALAAQACVHPVNPGLLCWRRAHGRRQRGWFSAARSLCAAGLLSFSLSQGPEDSWGIIFQQIMTLPNWQRSGNSTKSSVELGFPSVVYDCSG